MSGESLSEEDWRALLNHPVDEIFAHLEDGSIFAGSLSPAAAADSLANWYNATLAAEDAFMAAAAHASTHALVGQFSKHMLGSALATRGLVAYEHDLSSTWTSLVNAHTAAIMAGVNAALSVF